MTQQGTKKRFCSWLLTRKQLTHTAYSKLAVPDKQSLYKDYKEHNGK